MTLRPMIGLVTLALIASTVAPMLVLRPAVARADSGSHLQVTFTKWIVGDAEITEDNDVFDMVGVVGGEVGKGSFFGEVTNLTVNQTSGTLTIDAVYHLTGEKALLDADVHVTQGANGIADIGGTVVGGALAGAAVDGSYRVKTPCPVAPPAGISPDSTCFSGTLNVTS